MRARPVVMKEIDWCQPTRAHIDRVVLPAVVAVVKPVLQTLTVVVIVESIVIEEPILCIYVHIYIYMYTYHIVYECCYEF